MNLSQRIKLFKKAFSPKASTYDAVHLSRQRRMPYNARATDATVDVNSANRTTLVKLARYLYNSSPFTRGLINEKARYSVGTGIRSQAVTSSEAWNEEAEKYFTQWSKIADVQGRYTYREIQRLACIAIDRDGECFVRLVTHKKSGYPAIQLILAHRIGNAGKVNENGPRVIDGVGVNSDGRPIFYRYLTGPSGTPSESFEDIPANQIIHLGEACAGDELRFTSPLAPSVNHLRDISDSIGFEKMALKISSYIALAVRSNNPESADFFGDSASASTNDLTVESLGTNGGAIPRLGAGDDLVSWSSNRPSQNFQDFCGMLLREVCSSIGVPYEFHARPSEAGGAALRSVLVRAQRTFEQRQVLLMDRLCSRVWAHAITLGMQQERIPQNEDWYLATFQPPAAASVDMGHESAAHLNEVRAGLRTYREDYAERGIEWRDAMRQRAEESKYLKDLAAEFEVPIESIASFNPNSDPWTAEQETEVAPPPSETVTD